MKLFTTPVLVNKNISLNVILERTLVKESLKSKDRKYFEGWNNLTTFESENLEKVKDLIALDEEISQIMPQGFPERELLRFLQTYGFNM